MIVEASRVADPKKTPRVKEVNPGEKTKKEAYEALSCFHIYEQRSRVKVTPEVRNLWICVGRRFSARTNQFISLREAREFLRRGFRSSPSDTP